MYRGAVRLKETSNHLTEILVGKRLRRWIPHMPQTSKGAVIYKVRAVYNLIPLFSSNHFPPAIFCFILSGLLTVLQIVPFVFISWLFSHHSFFMATFLSALYLGGPYLSLWCGYACLI